MARLPIPGEDTGVWGSVLNDFLSVKHNNDGTLKTSGSLSTKVSIARQLIAGSSLTGGGDLSADRTISAHFGATAGTIAEGNDSRLVGAVQKGDLVINVKDYGATGDGATDDTAAIASAWAAVTVAGGGTLFFPAGHYLTTGVVLQNANNFTVKGERGAALWISPNTVSQPNLATHDILIIADCTDFTIEGITVDGRRDTIAGDQFLTANASSGQKNITVQDGTKYVIGQAVWLMGGQTANGGSEKNFDDPNLIITGISGNTLTVNNNLSHSYTGTGASGGAYLTQYQTGGVVAYTAAGRSLGNEDAQNGIHLLSCLRFSIRNCTAVNVWESPIKCGTGFQATSVTDGCSRGIITGNLVKHGYDQGVSVWSSQYITVNSNWAEDAGWAGISFTHCNDCTGSANVCIGNSFNPAFDLNEGCGLAVEGGVRVTVTGNVCTGNNSNGIRLGESPMFRGQGATTTTGALSAGATTITVANNSAFKTGSSHTIIDPNNTMTRETIYVASVASNTITLSRALRGAYASGATVTSRYGEDCLIVGNICSQSALSAGMRFDQQISLRIFGNDCSENGLLNGVFTDTQGTYGIQVENHCEGAVIQANTCRFNSQEGILVDTNCRGVVVQDNDVTGSGLKGSTTKHGIKCLGLVDGAVISNKCTYCTGDGIALENGGGNMTHHVQVSDNTCYYNNNSGIRADNGGWAITFSGNKIAYNGDTGMKILGIRDSLFTTNQCFNQSGQEGIRFDDNGSNFCTDNRVFDNLLYDDQGSPTQSWGFRELGSSARTVLRGNRTYGNTNSAQISLATSSRIAPDSTKDSNTVDSTIIGAASAIMPSGDMQNATFNVWIDENTNALKFQVKYSSGTVKNGSVTLS